MLRYHPAAPLDRYIECFWWSERSEPQIYCEHILPSGRAQIVFALHDQPMVYRPRGSSHWASWSGSIVRGPQRHHYIVGPKPRGVALGVSFRPGCAGYVLGVSSSELTDNHDNLSALWGTRAERLRERLAAANSPSEAFRLLEQSLRMQIQVPLLMHPAVAHALASCGQSLRVSEVQRQTGYSPKHFIARFTESVGLPPKQYYRIQRFTEVARCLAAAKHGALADLAASFGYSDQAHLTREFREFAGVPPTLYSGQSQSPLHHRVRDLGRSAGPR